MRENSRDLSRRELLQAAGKIGVAGSLTVAGVGGMGLLAGCGDNGGVTTSGIDSATLPWPYVKLGASDIKQIQETAHEEWFVGFCSFATFSAIISMLRIRVGDPYTGFPLQALIFGHGGTAGWGGTCGTLTGAGMALALAAGAKEGEQILNEVIQWYTQTELPIYKPDQPRVPINSLSKSDSPLCHVSVGNWMAREGVGFGSPQQMERCARLSSDVAAKSVEFLNQREDDRFAAVTKEPAGANGIPSQNNCTECHGDSVPPVPKPGGGEDLIRNY